MHPKTTRIILILLALGCVAAAFVAGYFRGYSRAKYDETVFGLGYYTSLYKLEQQGDTNRVADKTRFMIFGYSGYYDAHFSHEPLPYLRFVDVLAEARTIASQERSNVVSVSGR
jgi:hypothetical protein